MPGDHLVMECEYSTKGRSNFTLGGLGTYEEMCVAFMMVYPRPKLFNCMQLPSLMTSLRAVGLGWTFGPYVPGKTEEEVYTAIGNKMFTMDWTNDQIIDNFEEVRRYDKSVELCMSKSSNMLTEVNLGISCLVHMTHIMFFGLQIKEEEYPKFTPYTEVKDSVCPM